MELSNEQLKAPQTSGVVERSNRTHEEQVIPLSRQPRAVQDIASGLDPLFLPHRERQRHGGASGMVAVGPGGRVDHAGKYDSVLTTPDATCGERHWPLCENVRRRCSDNWTWLGSSDRNRAMCPGKRGHRRHNVCQALLPVVPLLIAAPAMADPQPAPTHAAPVQSSSGAPVASPPVPPGADESGSPWYGWQTLLVDASAIALLLGGLAANAPPAEVGGLVVYPTGAPVIHGVHQNWGRMVGSLGLRLGLPLVVALIASGDSCSDTKKTEDRLHCDEDKAFAPLIGLAIGAPIAMGIDAAFLAWESTPAPPPPKTVASSLRLLPRITPEQSSFQLTLAGALP